MVVERVDMGGYTLIENAPLATRNTLRVAARARLQRLAPTEAFIAQRDGAVLVDIRSDINRETEGQSETDRRSHHVPLGSAARAGARHVVGASNAALSASA